MGLKIFDKVFFQSRFLICTSLHPEITVPASMMQIGMRFPAAGNVWKSRLVGG
jgi:hypothetical protein